MVQFLWVCFGGAVGTGARYLVSGLLTERLGDGFPWGTFAVNLVGSLLLGALAHIGAQAAWMSPTTRLALATGVMGGFTTYSTFSLETYRLLVSDDWLRGAVYVLVTVMGCLAATAAGYQGARWMAP